MVIAQPPPPTLSVRLPFPEKPLRSLHNGGRLAEDTGGLSLLTPIRFVLPRIGITGRTLKKLEAIQLVREQRDSRTQQVSYNARPFVLCGLPLRHPPAGQLLYTRRNGSFVLEITAHPRFGLPYGQDRLIPIWMATLTLKQKSRTVHFGSPTQLLDYFRLPKDGAQYRRVRAAFQRIFAATIFFRHRAGNPKANRRGLSSLPLHGLHASLVQSQ